MHYDVRSWLYSIFVVNLEIAIKEWNTVMHIGAGYALRMKSLR